MLALHTRGIISGQFSNRVLKVLSISEALEGVYPLDRVLLDLRDGPTVSLEAITHLDVAGTLSHNTNVDGASVSALTNDDVVSCGDVVRVRREGQVSVLFRRGANANFLFATERCNSLCLMCSQPPRDVDDSWRVRELLDVVALVDRDVLSLGITGGEPTLLGDGLAEIIQSASEVLPQTRLHILTNGRTFSDSEFCKRLTKESSNVLWAVPLYADNRYDHDFVVQAEGAFLETLHGLYNLAERRQPIELRCVVHKQTAPRLEALSEFIWRNLPFVEHVAFMGLEPMGFAKGNRDLLYMDPAEYRAPLEAAAWYLHDRGISTSIYNTPLCLLSQPAWKLAKRSISDWKNFYPDTCSPCAVKNRCSGFFGSAGATWRSTAIQPISMEHVL